MKTEGNSNEAFLSESHNLALEEEGGIVHRIYRLVQIGTPVGLDGEGLVFSVLILQANLQWNNIPVLLVLANLAPLTHELFFDQNRQR